MAKKRSKKKNKKRSKKRIPGLNTLYNRGKKVTKPSPKKNAGTVTITFTIPSENLLNSLEDPNSITTLINILTVHLNNLKNR